MDWNRAVILWDVETGQQKFKLIESQDYISSITFSPDGQTLITFDKNKIIVKFWNAQTGKLKREWKLEHNSDNHTISADGRLLAGIKDGIIKIWDVQTGLLIRNLLVNKFSEMSVELSSDGKILASMNDKKIDLWDTFSWKVIDTASDLSESLNSKRVFAFSPNMMEILSDHTDRDRIVTRWDVQTGKETGNFCLGLDAVDITAVAFSPDSKIVAFGCSNAVLLADNTFDGGNYAVDKKLKMENTNLGIANQENWVRVIAFSPDGRSLACGFNDNVIRLWRVKDEWNLRLLG